MKYPIIVCLLLASCTGRIEPPAPVEDKQEEMFGPREASKKTKQEQMIAGLIEKYSLHSDNGTAHNTGWDVADISHEPQEIKAPVIQEEFLPKPLKKAPPPVAAVEEEEIKEPAVKEEKEVIKPAPAEKTILADTSTEMIWPVKGNILKAYGSSKDGTSNDGISIQAKEGTPVLAVADGTVAYSTNKLSGLGNLVFVTHPNGFISVYAHLKKINVNKGDVLTQGASIGTVGKTGTVKTPQLYFELRKKEKGKAISFDPAKFLKGQN